jgi:hypothetical protein
MISETELWKADLIKTASKLLKRILQKKWSSRSLFNLEKELFLGFFIVRKLIESNEVDPDFKSKKYKISVFPYRELSPEEIDKLLPYESCPSKAKKKKY